MRSTERGTRKVVILTKNSFFRNPHSVSRIDADSGFRVPSSALKVGQSTTEFILMLLLLTLIGGIIVKKFIGNAHGRGGAVHKMTIKAANNIAQD